MAKTCFIAAHPLIEATYYKDLVELTQDALDWTLVHSLADKPEIILYAGGTDINPKLYGQSKHDKTDKPIPLRDGMEIQAYLYSQHLSEFDVWNIGICRGMQLLNVMHGGTLQQHVEDHAPTGDAIPNMTHAVEYLGKSKSNTYGTHVNSWHHQMIIPPRNGKEVHNPYEILVQTIGLHNDPEAIYFPKTKSIGVQWRPEWGLEGGSFRLFKRILDDYMEAAA